MVSAASAAHVALALLLALQAAASPLVLRASARVNLADADLNVNCGGPAVGRFVAEDDAWIVGETSQFVKDDAVIGGAEKKNEPMYKSHRYGMQPAGPWGYDIPVKEPGVYGCTAHFVETASSAFRPGARVFDLTMSGAKDSVASFKAVDVFKATEGKHFVVYTRTAPRLVVTRYLRIRIQKTAASEQPGFISGITCERTGALPAGYTAEPAPEQTLHASILTEKFTPIGEYTRDGASITKPEINVNAGGGKVGRFSAEDPDWIAYGSTTTFGSPGHGIGGAEAINLPALDSTRYGLDGSTFGYQIPIAPSAAGIWDCTLHWAELIASMKPGMRVFDVQVQDRMFSHYDVIQATGGAEFTSTVLTFEEIPVSDVLVIKLTAIKGDPFLSAITCARRTKTTSAEALAQIKVRADANKVASDDKPTVTPEPTVSRSDILLVPELSLEPEPSTGPIVARTDPAPSPFVVPAILSASVASASSSASASASSSALPTPSSSSTPAPTTSASPTPSQSLIGEIGPAPTDDPQPSSDPSSSEILEDIRLDRPLKPNSDQVLQNLRLEISLPSGTQLDNKLKDAVKALLSKGSNTSPASWAMTNITAKVSGSFYVETSAPSTLAVGVDGVFNKNAKSDLNKLTDYLIKGEATTDLQNAGYKDATVKLAKSPNVSEFAKPKAPASSVSTIVAAVVGTLLGALLIVALLSFFVIYRHRRNEVNPAAFDAPPPDMEDSDGEGPSSAAHSANSVDFLDDDSTFTAATSRGGGDVEAGVTLDKDVWGRGSS